MANDEIHSILRSALCVQISDSFICRCGYNTWRYNECPLIQSSNQARSVLLGHTFPTSPTIPRPPSNPHHRNSPRFMTRPQRNTGTMFDRPRRQVITNIYAVGWRDRGGGEETAGEAGRRKKPPSVGAVAAAFIDAERFHRRTAPPRGQYGHPHSAHEPSRFRVS